VELMRIFVERGAGVHSQSHSGARRAGSGLGLPGKDIARRLLEQSVNQLSDEEQLDELKRL
jgi:hypothetical protein